MEIALVLLVGLLGVFVLVLALPVRIELRLARDDTWQYAGAVRLFGQYGPRIALSGKKQKAKASLIPKSRGGHGWPREPFRIVHAALRLVTDALHCVRLDTAEVDMKLGLGDPADTGRVFGLLAPLIYGFSGASRLKLYVEPIFDGPVLSGRATLILTLIPLRLLQPVLRFGWSVFGPGSKNPSSRLP